jgi:hypothetical protein
MLGFTDRANLQEDALWPVPFALKELTAGEEAKIVALVKKAATKYSRKETGQFL